MKRLLQLGPLIVIGCATHAPELPDAAWQLPDSGSGVPSDSGVDLPPASDPPVGTARIYVASLFMHLDPTAWIIVHDRHGAPWSVTLPTNLSTDVKVPAGASITLLQRGPFGERNRTTFVGVEPGDVLQPTTSLSNSVEGITTVRFPRFSPTTRRYHLVYLGEPGSSSNCARDLVVPPDVVPSETLEALVPITTACADPGPQMLVVTAYDAQSTLVGSLYVNRDLSWTNDLTTVEWTPPIDAQVTLANAPSAPWGSTRQVCLRPWMKEPALPALQNVLRRSLPAVCAPIPAIASSQVTVRVPGGLPVLWEHVATVPKTRSMLRHVQVSPTPDASLDLGWSASASAGDIDVDQTGARPFVRIASTLGALGGVTTIKTGVGAGLWTIVHPNTPELQLPALPPGFEGFQLETSRYVTTTLYLPGQFTTYAEMRSNILARPTQAPMEQRSVELFGP